MFYGIPEHIAEPIVIIMVRSNTCIPKVPPDLTAFQTILVIPFSGGKFVITANELGEIIGGLRRLNDCMIVVM
jgi:hypothetical protein